MTPIRLTASPGPDGQMHLSIPVPPGKYVVVVEPEAKPVGQGWPPGFFDRTCGSMPDFSIEPRNQGEFEKRESLD